MSNIKKMLNASSKRYICGFMTKGKKVYLSNTKHYFDRTREYWESLEDDENVSLVNITSLIDDFPKDYKTSLVYREGFYPFKQGEVVLVRKSNDALWKTRIYSHDNYCILDGVDKTKELKKLFDDRCAVPWKYIIPFDINKVSTI